MSDAAPRATLATELTKGLAALGLELSSAQQEQLLDYLGLLARWSRVYNLTAVREPMAMLTHHLLDCLAVVGPLRNQLDRLWPRWEAGDAPPLRALDVGSGAGLPGVVLAICCPTLRVDCVDTVGKKAAFVQQVAGHLKLSHLRGVHARAESLGPQYQVIASRAFAALPDLVRWTQGALEEGGVWMAMKGQRPQQEIDALPRAVEVFHVEPLRVPGLDAARCLVWMRKAEPTQPAH